LRFNVYAKMKMERGGFCLMNLGKLILALRDVLDWSITFFLSFFVMDMANPEMA